MADKKTSKPAEPVLPDYRYDEPEKVVPDKGSAGYDTPSGLALAKGKTGDDYQAEKAKKRWGHS